MAAAIRNVALVALLALVAVACSDDDPEAASSEPSEAREEELQEVLADGGLDQIDVGFAVACITTDPGACGRLASIAEDDDLEAIDAACADGVEDACALATALEDVGGGLDADACPGGEPVASTPAVTGDVDGDGEDDGLFIADGAIVAELADGRAQGPLPDATESARVLTALDVDGSPGEEVFVLLDNTPDIDLVALVAFDDCAFVRPTLDGAPNVFRVGATPTEAHGVYCVDADGDGAVESLQVSSGQSEDDGATYDGTSRTLDVTASTLTETGTEPYSAPVELQYYHSLFCGDLAPVPPDA